MAQTPLDYLKDLLMASGPSSYESRPAALWRERAKSYGATVREDVYGNSFASFNETAKPNVMLAGHVDEIGLVVTYIDKEGYVYFRGVGGWDSQQLVGQRVNILGYNGDVMGVIGKKAIHMMPPDERKKISRIQDMWIDIGARDDEEAKAYVRPGDAAVIDQPVLELLNGRLVSKALDNRIGAYIVLEAAKRAHEAGTDVGITAVATVQEEIGHIGAGIAAFGLEPELALAIDVTHATDIPGANKKLYGDIELGSGVSLTFGSINHRGLVHKLIDIADAEEIPYRLEATPTRTFTDADDIAKVHAGVPTAVVSIPNRYMHSPNEMIDPEDLEHVINFISVFLQKLDSSSEFKQPS